MPLTLTLLLCTDRQATAKTSHRRVPHAGLRFDIYALILRGLMDFISEVFLLYLVEKGMEMNSIPHKNTTDMRIHTRARTHRNRFPRNLALATRTILPSHSSLPLCSVHASLSLQASKDALTHPSYFTHSLKASPLKAGAHCVGTLPKPANKRQIKWKHGKEFQACIILAWSPACNF